MDVEYAYVLVVITAYIHSDKEKVRAVKKIGSEVIFFKPLTEMFSSDRFCYFNTIFEIITKLYNYSTVSM